MPYATPKVFNLSRDFLNHARSMCILQSLCEYYNLYVNTTISIIETEREK